MAEIKYESKIGQIAANDAAVFSVLSNLENINRFRDVIPQDKIKDESCCSDKEFCKESEVSTHQLILPPFQNIRRLRTGQKSNLTNFDLIFSKNMYIYIIECTH